MAGKMYGYIRVSTKEQNEDRQRIAMDEYGGKCVHRQAVGKGL